MPLQFVQGSGHVLGCQREGALQQGWRHQVPQDGGSREHALRRRAEPSNADADGGDDGIGQVSRQALVEGAERLGPCSLNGSEIEAEGDGAEELDGE